MKKRILTLLCIVVFCSHDMYLKLDSYILQPNQKSKIQLFNGTFDKSENTIDRDRMLDASLLGNGVRTKIEDAQWEEIDSTTILSFTAGNSGTWIVGVSTRPRNIAMKAEAFNKYLKHDGVKDMLTERAENKTLNQDAVEKYSKHVKAIFQVGDKKTADWKTILGYPIEFVPVENPYNLYTGDNLQVKLLRNGVPLANQLVYADYRASKHGHHHNSTEEHSHGEKTHSHKKDEKHSHEDNNAADDHTHTTGQELRTDSNGIATVNLTNDGIWYLRTIHLVNSEEKGLTHESNWATLTFEVTHHHRSEEHHNHAKEDGLPMYIFIVGSIIFVAILFFFFNREK
ncbi:DUF4198 domain-containing protein [uncultured Polaribacter sp.]|uniref:DUF4198 domain-containing protein n=1 Tax=uncultured Polaribacter sp. TaxID=174711 RepID=UPI0026127EE9|nr:DUF4198 domain-containing protein [uncultured Polaribacter sp.]